MAVAISVDMPFIHTKYQGNPKGTLLAPNAAARLCLSYSQTERLTLCRLSKIDVSGLPLVDSGSLANLLKQGCFSCTHKDK